MALNVKLSLTNVFSLNTGTKKSSSLITEIRGLLLFVVIDNALLLARGLLPRMDGNLISPTCSPGNKALLPSNDVLVDLTELILILDLLP